ncbi:hypothetical protein BJV78DRAFT_1156939 [Lactifluus subvellereus]|nr:hypothetical protein BJV78DRAFT_1156939 [Lactifluus subvellereus]
MYRTILKVNAPVGLACNVKCYQQGSLSAYIRPYHWQWGCYLGTRCSRAAAAAAALCAGSQNSSAGVGWRAYASIIVAAKQAPPREIMVRHGEIRVVYGGGVVMGSAGDGHCPSRHGAEALVGRGVLECRHEMLHILLEVQGAERVDSQGRAVVPFEDDHGEGGVARTAQRHGDVLGRRAGVAEW